MTNLDAEPVGDSGSESDADTDDGDGDGDHDAHAGNEIDVEVSEDLSADLSDRVDAPEYVLYGGKGGVGKTTMAAATALASAADGTPTLVVSTDPAHSLSDTLDADVPADPAQVRDDVPLYAAEIDPDAAMQGPLGGMGGGGGFAPDDADESGFDADADPASGPDADPFDEGEGPFGGANGPGPFEDGGDADGPMGGTGGMEGMADLFGDEGAPLMGGPMPGADEAAAMQQLLRYLDDPRFDRVVVDTAPTGHTLRLLELPEILDSMVGRMVKMRRKFSGMMDGIKGMFGMGDGDAGGMADLDELRDRIEHLREVLRDPARTDFRVVMIPEEMSVTESERLVERLDEYGIPVKTIVVNRVMEDLADVADADADVADDWVVSPDLEHCEFCQRRWNVQQEALRRATDLFRGRDVRRVPLLADEVRGEAALRVVAACLS